MASRRVSTDRRTYLKAVGSGSIVALAGLAGCTGGNGGQTTTTTTANETTTTTSGTTTAETTTTTAKKAIVAGTAPGFPPFEMKQGGNLVGFDVDLLEAVVGATDSYTLKGWQEFEFNSLIPALTNEKIDVIAAAMTITADRDKTIDFSDSYYSADQAILVQKDGSFQPTKLADLANHDVGAQKGTTGENVVQTKLVDTGDITQQQYHSYGNYVLAVLDLVNGNIDAVVVDTPVAQTFADEQPVTIAFTYQTGENYGFGIRQGDAELQTALNAGLKAVKDDGTYQQLTAKWFTQQS